MKFIIFLFLLFCFQKCTFTAYIENSYYKDIIVAISPTISANDVKVKSFIENLEEIFSSASGLLCTATDGFAAFETVRLLIPSWWKLKNLVVNRPRGETFHNADFRLVDSNEVKINRAGYKCGQRGRNVEIPIQFANTETTYAERHLVSLWSQLRYGVYSEAAPGLYFDPELNDHQPNSCSNVHLKWKATAPDNPSESCSVGENEWNLPEGCQVTIDKNNEEVKSSLLFDVGFSNMKAFCNASTHNRLAQTPHNRFCGGLSVSEVIKRNEDFDGIELPTLTCTDLNEVSMEIIQYNCQRVFIAIVLKKIEDVSKVVNNLKPSLTVALDSTLMSGTILTIVVEDKILNLTVDRSKPQFSTEVISKLNEILRDVADIKQCASCSLKNVTEEIKKSTEHSHCDYSFMFISDVTDLESSKLDEENNEQTADISERRKRNLKKPSNEDNVEDVADDLKRNGVNFYGVSLSPEENDGNNLVSLLAKTCNGKIIQADSADRNSLARLLMNPIMEMSGNDKQTIVVIVDEEILEPSTKHVVDISLDEAESQDLSIEIEHYLVPKTDIIILKTIDEVETYTVNDCTNFSELNWTTCTFRNVKPGKYKLEITLPDASPVSTHAVVISETSSLENYDVEIFVHPEFEVSFEDNHLFIGVSVKKGSRPVLKAEVKAIVKGDDAEFPLNLTDDGIGHDIEFGNGLYSAGLDTCKDTGRYAISISVTGTSETCAVITKGCELTGAFQRTYSGGSINIKNCGLPDKLSGSKVTDFRLLSRDETTFTFAWTDTWVKETITSYTLRMLPKAPVNDEAWKDAFVLKELSPMDPMTKREVSVSILSPSKIIVVALVAVDKHGKIQPSLSTHVNLHWVPKPTDSTSAEAKTTTESFTVSSSEKSSSTEAEIQAETTQEEGIETTTLENTVVTKTDDTSKTIPDRTFGDYPGIICSLVLSSIIIACLCSYLWVVNRRMKQMCQPVEHRLSTAP